jgi:hypothetical protein
MRFQSHQSERSLDDFIASKGTASTKLWTESEKPSLGRLLKGRCPKLCPQCSIRAVHSQIDEVVK